MINTKELLYVVNEFDMPLKPRTRQEAFKKGYWRRTVHVWIINDKNEILCQKRSSKKDISPGKWEPQVGGHLGPGDNYFTGAVREVREETGLPIKPKDLQLLKIYKDHDYREYRGIFYCKWNSEIHEVISEEDEVEEVKFIHIDTLKKHILEDQSDMWIRSGYEHEMFSALN